MLLPIKVRLILEVWRYLQNCVKCYNSSSFKRPNKTNLTLLVHQLVQTGNKYNIDNQWIPLIPMIRNVTPCGNVIIMEHRSCSTLYSHINDWLIDWLTNTFTQASSSVSVVYMLVFSSMTLNNCYLFEIDSSVIIRLLLNKSQKKDHLWYHKISNIRRTLTCNKLVDHSDVVGASPVGAAPTTSSFSTYYLASIVWAKTTATGDGNHFSFGIWYVLY